MVRLGKYIAWMLILGLVLPACTKLLTTDAAAAPAGGVPAHIELIGHPEGGVERTAQFAEQQDAGENRHSCVCSDFKYLAIRNGLIKKQTDIDIVRVPTNDALRIISNKVVVTTPPPPVDRPHRYRDMHAKSGRMLT